MFSLIGGRFLKRFIGSRMYRRSVDPAREVTLPANESIKPDVPGYSIKENLPDTDATLENEQTSEVNPLAVPEHGLD